MQGYRFNYEPEVKEGFFKRHKMIIIMIAIMFLVLPLYILMLERMGFSGKEIFYILNDRAIHVDVSR